jgi:hypothetical protein
MPVTLCSGGAAVVVLSAMIRYHQGKKAILRTAGV